MIQELIYDDQGRVIGEIRERDAKYEVWKRERTQDPPGSKHQFLGRINDLKEARRVARVYILS